LVWFKISSDVHLQLIINLDLLLLQLHESTTDPAEVAAMRGNIPAGCPVSTLELRVYIEPTVSTVPGLSSEPITVLPSSDDKV
jgi:hypothetical protein